MLGILDYFCENSVYNMNTRLKQFLTAENISQSQFADTLGVARASISHILSGRNKPGFDFLASLARHYPSLNLTWLITGRGRMYGNSQQPAETYFAVTSAASAPQDELTDDAISPSEDENGLFADLSPEISDSRGTTEGWPAGNAPAGRRQEAGVVRTGSGTAGTRERGPQEYAAPAIRRISRVVVFFDDNTYQELK